MIEVRLEFKDFTWVDVVDPSADDLARLAERYNLHPLSVADCLEPAHLPKAEVIDDVCFAVLRVFDPECAGRADTIRGLTHKVALFHGPKLLLSLQRVDVAVIARVRASYAARPEPRATPVERVVTDLVGAVVESFQPEINRCLDQLEHFESEIFRHRTRRKFRLMEGYYLRRRASVLKTVLHMTQEPLQKIQGRVPAGRPSALAAPWFQNVREQIAGALFSVADIGDSLDTLIQLHLSLQSQRSNEASRRTNEVMRILTIFSCFFLPINFIAAIYGMNFQHMPEISSFWGYPGALIAMGLSGLVTLRWFRNRGWLKGSGQSYAP